MVRRLGWMGSVLVGTLLSMSGCYAHVQLTAPPATAPVAVRMKAYHALRPLSYEVTETQTQSGTVLSRRPDYLTLANGQTVHHPEDLLPVVASTSACAAAVNRYLPAAHTAAVTEGVGYAGIGAGLAIGLYGLYLSEDALNQPTAATLTAEAQQGENVLLVALGTTVVGAGVAVLGNLLWGQRAAEDQETAYQTYDDGLMSRLSLKAPDDVQDASHAAKGHATRKGPGAGVQAAAPAAAPAAP